MRSEVCVSVSESGGGFSRQGWVLLDGLASAHEDKKAVSGVRAGRRPALAGRVSGEGTEVSAGAGEDDEVIMTGTGEGGEGRPVSVGERTNGREE